MMFGQETTLIIIMILADIPIVDTSAVGPKTDGAMYTTARAAKKKVKDTKATRRNAASYYLKTRSVMILFFKIRTGLSSSSGPSSSGKRYPHPCRYSKPQRLVERKKNDTK